MPITKPIPEPNDNPRRVEASRRRQLATEVAINRPQPGIDRAGPPTSNNGEEAAFTQSYASSFTKGLPRDKFGLVDPHSYGHFVDAINHESAAVAGGVDRFDMTVPLGPYQEPDANVPIMDIGDHPKFYTTKKGGTAFKVRNWESPRAGHVYDLEGPDADAVCMPPAPKVISDEMAVEMAEVYAMALLRDTPFETISKAGNGTHGYSAKQAALDIADMDWFDPSVPRAGVEAKRLMARELLHKPSGSENAAKKTARAKKNAANLFRGSTPGCKDGPYVSQFLIAGTSGRGGEGSSASKHPVDSSTFGPEDGCIVYGNQSIDQRVFSAKEGMDYMTEWLAWMDVQNAANKKGLDQFESKRRFITTPRDLATYVHFDELYQAYLNATFMVAGMGVPADQGFPTGRKTDRTRGSFATFGGPHVLALLTEVSTRALRAVRRQKYNYHRRCRPEAIGGMLSLSASTDVDAVDHVWDARSAFGTMRSKLPSGLLDKINARNAELATASESAKRHLEVPTADQTSNGLHKSAFDEGDPNYLLPMAFPEGSPMHPAYGAGHATVAGACVTVVKAFFNMYQDDDSHELRAYPGDKIFEPDLGSDGAKLVDRTSNHPSLTLAGELNKLAANISIGRNMAGVHFYTDYFDSLRMGERIAIGILQEQMTNYPEDVSMTLPGFGDDGTGLGEKIRIATSPEGANSDGHPVVELWNNTSGAYEDASVDWWLCRL